MKTAIAKGFEKHAEAIARILYREMLEPTKPNEEYDIGILVYLSDWCDQHPALKGSVLASEICVLASQHYLGRNEPGIAVMFAHRAIKHAAAPGAQATPERCFALEYAEVWLAEALVLDGQHEEGLKAAREAMESVENPENAKQLGAVIARALERRANPVGGAA